ncbi:hypothetical protein ACIQKE_10600 [Streptomyces griseoviridis]
MREDLDHAEGRLLEVVVVVGLRVREIVAGEGVDEGRVEGGLGGSAEEFTQ